MPIVRVALNVPVGTLFDYYAEHADQENIGLRVSVPFGKRRLAGIIMEVVANTEVPPEKLKTIQSIFTDNPPLPKELLNLFAFCSQYYHHPIGMVIMNGLPAALRTTKPIKPKKDHSATWNNTQLRLTDAGKRIALSSIPKRQRIARNLLVRFQQVESIPGEAFKEDSSRIKQLIQQWLVSGWISTDSSPHSAQDNAVTDSNIPTLTVEQDHAVNTILSAQSHFHVSLLHGITGSGKTEVYLRLIAAMLMQDKQVLVLVPEINLTPQLEAIFHNRFPCTNLISLHSGLNDTERLQGWLQAQTGEANIVLGTRLAIFTPLPNLGLIIVDEEHDHSFKQQDGLRYSARDLAIFRSKQVNIPVILGSATPSLESYHSAITGRYRVIQLTSRAIKNAALPTIQTIDTRIHKTFNGLSQPLLQALRTNLSEQQQSIIFINRRGYAPTLLCKSCAWTAACVRCSSRLVVHLRDKDLRCHYCGHQERLPIHCPECGNQDLTPFGQGTQRVTETLNTYFPNARILRIDRDSTRRKDAWRSILQKIHNQEIDILVGTQILAKGHDFPNLSLIGILNSDNSLYSTDFRASERLFAQLMQISGRAGRSNNKGQVLIQTEFPDHPLYQALQKQNFDALAKNLLIERKIAGFPPYVHQAVLRAEAHRIETVIDFLSTAAKLAKDYESIELFDPVPAQMLRLKGMERGHLLVQSASRKQLQIFLLQWQKQLSTVPTQKIRWVLDVDPVEL
ncbi:MAG: primosomal protein N' [Nitrosomonas sp.]